MYAINPSTQRCKWVAIDADYKNALEDLLKLQYHLWQDDVEPALEMSKRGGHRWILLATPLLAKECRIYIHDLAARLGLPVKGSGLADGIEFFPRHNAIGDGEFGNAIRAPLGVHRGAGRRFWFYGADYTLEAQMEYLDRLRKLTEEELRRFIAGVEIPQASACVERTQPRPEKRLRWEFRILDHIGTVRRVGRNYVARVHASKVAVNCQGCEHSHYTTVRQNKKTLAAKLPNEKDRFATGAVPRRISNDSPARPQEPPVVRNELDSPLSGPGAGDRNGGLSRVRRSEAPGDTNQVRGELASNI